MDDSRRLIMTRDQVSEVTGGNHQRIKEFEKLLDAINAPPVAPITAPISGNTVYNIGTDVTFQTIWITAANLKASAGGPFTLTLTTGSGSTVVIPIGASTDTILSGDLLFDIYVDSSGNVISKDWTISGSNANGNYEYSSGGNLIQQGFVTPVSVTFSASGNIFSTPAQTIVLPVSYFDTSYVIPSDRPISTASEGFWCGQGSSTSKTVSQYTDIIWSYFSGTRTVGIEWYTSGKWK